MCDMYQFHYSILTNRKFSFLLIWLSYVSQTIIFTIVHQTLLSWNSFIGQNWPPLWDGAKNSHLNLPNTEIAPTHSNGYVPLTQFYPHNAFWNNTLWNDTIRCIRFLCVKVLYWPPMWDGAKNNGSRCRIGPHCGNRPPIRDQPLIWVLHIVKANVKTKWYF